MTESANSERVGEAQPNDVEALRRWCEVSVMDNFPSAVLASCLDEIESLRAELRGTREALRIAIEIYDDHRDDWVGAGYEPDSDEEARIAAARVWLPQEGQQ